MTQRQQQTIRKEVETEGVGFITGADVRIRFLPAPADHGIVFQRVDLADQPCVSATLDNLIPRQRRTGLSANGATIELVEHVLSALAGLQIDNCIVQLNAPETPGFDGSCREVTELLLESGIDKLDQERATAVIQSPITITENSAELSCKPFAGDGMTVSYICDYGAVSPIRAQVHTLELTPERFVNEICFARTFVLESEVKALRSLGYGSRTTYQDLLVFGNQGVIENTLRVDDECARHKILDCIGDFALLGCDLVGYFSGWRSGHNTNHELMKAVRQQIQSADDDRDQLQAA